MSCENKGTLLGAPGIVDLEKELNDSNARTMAIETGKGNVLDQIGAQISIGRRQDLFWIIMTVILAGAIILTKVFGKRKRRR